VVPKSEAVIGWCYAGIAAVAVALVAGLAHAATRRRAADAPPRANNSLFEAGGTGRHEINP
jgi:hypothetical protein